ncbi:GrpB family protein [Nocardioides sp. SR21]|uniref:GrpB family protein n=1 Tax=Nocardioides sp. SR21 TaxID=2919501 RepID=UPI001FAB2B29|nr:GrpB family protein [Nocardioides sp. SR21]
MRRDPIVIQPYDAAWPARFEEQRAVLEPVLGVPVHHIGSTAVPGLPAKPIIDMLAVVEDHTRVPGERLESAGWVHAPEPGDEEQRKLSYCHPTVEHRTHHLHVIEHDSDGWRDWLLFRDYLCEHPDEAERYAALKRELAAQDDTDRPRYRAGKAPLIAELMVTARSGRPRPSAPR